MQAIEHFDERDSGKVKLSPPSHPLLLEPDPVPKSMPGAAKPAPSGKTLSDALAGFHRERMAGGCTLAAKTINMKWLAHSAMGLEQRAYRNESRSGAKFFILKFQTSGACDNLSFR
ncbi:MAG: hypothetical protein JNN06_05125 [Gemmobacter sp.]|uniref:hypothetical protein n=1 Tax=Gemmobacter sp. TaxID=1898957 RepID=UPI001A3BD355|nr:hypothetical protein [Gemmobacter sp.]MBL8561643.1 hypothetical protein [Gemmobacter sp.]